MRRGDQAPLGPDRGSVIPMECSSRRAAVQIALEVAEVRRHDFDLSREDDLVLVGRGLGVVALDELVLALDRPR